MTEKQYCYKYPRPALTADSVVFGFDGADLNVLLIQRKNEPFEGDWAFPGGFMEIEETIEACAFRELREETGIIPAFMDQVGTFSAIDRDPRGRVVTVAFYTLVKLQDYQPEAADDAAHADWFRIDELPSLAFDHTKILRFALSKLKERLKQIANDQLQPVTSFSVPELQRLYEAVGNER
ncbi:NUDIX domain-containing protein [Odoribacter laneus]|uniref:NUDIX domain-containing protein n=2 Tax=Odoribacter laneus TaxID=626933 RepID=UPI003AB46AFD